MVANQREQQPDEWNHHTLNIMLSMFPKDRRPVVLTPYTDQQFSGHNLLCDRIIVWIFSLFYVDFRAYLGTHRKRFIYWDYINS